MYRKGPDELAATRAELVSYGAHLLDDGLAAGSAGNLRVRMGDIVAITPSGIPYADLRPADICLVTPARSASRPIYGSGRRLWPRRLSGSRALARCWISWAVRNRPWPTGSPQPRPAR
jgi:antitoxin (DNA-binding transcriptional repressor) of toxin-antitoxin stability system